MNSRSTSRIVLQCSGVSSDESTPGVVAVSGVEKVCWSFGAREEVATFIADVCGWLFFLPAFYVQAMGTPQPSQHTANLCHLADRRVEFCCSLNVFYVYKTLYEIVTVLIVILK